LSSLHTGKERSCISNQPPGLRFLSKFSLALLFKILETLVNILERLTDQFLLLNSAVELSRMNEVELLFKDPWLVGIINYKGQVWRYTDTN
jgi:hypothetical protein